MANNDDSHNRDAQDQPRMMIPPTPQTKRPRPKLRVDANTAALLHKLDEIPPGTLVLIAVDIRPDGRRSWSLAPITAEG